MQKAKTFMELKIEQQKLCAQLNKINAQIMSIPCSKDMEAALGSDDLFCTRTRAELLAEELAQRDCAMSRQDIEIIFRASGFDFTESDIDAAMPDDEASVREWSSRYLER